MISSLCERLNVYCSTVAARLVAKSEVYCYGQRLPITGCTSVTFSPVSDRCQHQNFSDSSVPNLQFSHPGFQESQAELPVTVAAVDTGDKGDIADDISDSYEDFTADLNTTKDVMAASASHQHSVDFDQHVTDCSEWSDTVEPMSTDSPPLQQSLTWPDDDSNKELSTTDEGPEILYDDSDDVEDDSCDIAICKRAVAEQDNNETLIRPQKSQRLSELLHEQSQQNFEEKATRPRRTWKINFFEEKLWLLEKMIAAGSVDFPCEMQVIMAENAVELVADEENATESEIRLYELIANFYSISLHLPSGVVNLLMSSRGQRWLQTQLASLDAVFYAKDSACPFVIGSTCRTSMDAKFLLETALSRKKIPFVDEHVIFLRSAQWAFAIEKFQSESFVVVKTEFGENVIVLEGSIDALNNISKSIELMLKQNGRVRHKMSMSAEQFQLLMHFRVEIHDRLRLETLQHQENRYL